MVIELKTYGIVYNTYYCFLHNNMYKCSECNFTNHQQECGPNVRKVLSLLSSLKLKITVAILTFRIRRNIW